MRIGIFGGTFDPVHMGHLILAEQCREQAELHQVHFIPAARPPHKSHSLTPFDRRFDMLELAVSGHSAFVIDSLENQRSGPSYTVDTLAAIGEQFPNAELCLIIGSDTLQDLPNWYEPQQVVSLAHIIAVARPGWEMPKLEKLAKQLQIDDDRLLRVQIVEMPLIDLSSTNIRTRISQGQSVRYMIPRAVEAFICDKGIYRN